MRTDVRELSWQQPRRMMNREEFDPDELLHDPPTTRDQIPLNPRIKRPFIIPRSYGRPKPDGKKGRDKSAQHKGEHQASLLL